MEYLLLYLYVLVVFIFVPLALKNEYDIVYHRKCSVLRLFCTNFVCSIDGVFFCHCLFVSTSDAVFFVFCFHCFVLRALHDVFVCLLGSDAATLVLFFVVLFSSASYGAFVCD